MSIENSHSNQNWLISSIAAITCLEESSGELRRQLLAMAINLYSTYVVSFALQPDVTIQTLVLHNALFSQKRLKCNFAPDLDVHDLPSNLMTDDSSFDSSRSEKSTFQFADSTCEPEIPTSDKCQFVLESFDLKFPSKLPGYVSGNRQTQPKTDYKKSKAWTLKELDQQIQRFVTNHWAQESSPKTSEQTQQWKLIRLNDQVYRGEKKLTNYVGDAVNVRYDPNNPSVIKVYIQDGDREVFIANAHLVSGN